MIKDLYIDCPNGIAGDMLLSALMDLGIPDDLLSIQIKSLGLEESLNIKAYESESYGIRGLRISLDKFTSCDLDRSWPGIKQFINKSSLKDSIKKNTLATFEVLAKAESSVHGCDLGNVHFHEIGSIDTLINIVGVCSVIDYLKPKNIYCSPLPFGKGVVKTFHGILPVPVPAVLEIARKKNMPFANSDNFPDGELTTPTGIALMSIFASPCFNVDCFDVLSVGIGLGQKDLNRPNILRICQIRNSLFDQKYKSNSDLCWQDLISQQACIDDASPEDLAELINQLRSAGAIEVISNVVQMKKGRQGFRIEAIMHAGIAKDVRMIWFSQGTTIGLRESSFGRWVLPRRSGFCQTSFGAIKVKQVKRLDGTLSIKAEHADLIKMSQLTGKSLDEVRKEVHMNLSNFESEEDWSF